MDIRLLGLIATGQSLAGGYPPKPRPVVQGMPRYSTNSPPKHLKQELTLTAGFGDMHRHVGLAEIAVDTVSDRTHQAAA